MKCRIEKNKETLLEYIEHYSTEAINHDMAFRLSNAIGAYEALCMVDGDNGHTYTSEHHGGKGHVLTHDMAEHWVSGLINEDGTRGAHWSFEQVKQIMTQKCISADPCEFYAVLNALYSDYCKVFQKYGVGGNMDFYLDMAKAWLDDKDAESGKVAIYYEYIVKR